MRKTAMSMFAGAALLGTGPAMAGMEKCLNLSDAALQLPAAAATLPNPVLFVTQLALPDAPAVAAVEAFPEPLPSSPVLSHPLYGTAKPFNFKHFFLWHLNTDGTGEEIVNHLGRHELVHYFDESYQGPANGLTPHFNPRSRDVTVENMLQAAEDPTRPHRYVFVDGPHFHKQSAGRLLVADLPPQLDGDAAQLRNLTHPRALDPSDAAHTGDRFRDPMVTSNGAIVASFANACGTGGGCNDDTRDLDPAPNRVDTNYRFRLHRLRDANARSSLRRCAMQKTVRTEFTRCPRSRGVWKRSGGATTRRAA